MSAATRAAAWGSVGQGGTAAPAQVTNLALTVASSTELDLTWDATAGATSYLVERSPAGAGTWASVATPATNAFANTGLTPGTSYDYRVSAVGPGGTGTPSATATATTPLDYVARWGVRDYYKLEEASGTRAATVGTDNLTATNAPGNMTGKLGNALAVVAASSQYVSAVVASISQAQDIWAAAWVYANDLSGGGQYWLGTSWCHAIGSANTLGVYRPDFGANVTLVPANPKSGRWIFTLVGWDAANSQMVLYVDNQGPSTLACPGMTFSGTVFKVGQRGDNVGYWDGGIDAVAYGVGASGTLAPLFGEIASRLYNGGAGREYPFV